MAFPSLTEIFKKLTSLFSDGMKPILLYLRNSMLTILKGLGTGMGFAVLFSGLSIANHVFDAIYHLIVSVFDLIPGVALLPILMITVGANNTSIFILVVHSVLWPISRNMIDGFRSVPQLYIEAGRNIGLQKSKLIAEIYIPSSFANLLSGMRIGWARAWRGLISAEMIFGSARAAGIGVFINNARTVWIDYTAVYAAILLIVFVGIVVEFGVFRLIERTTVKKWGMIR